MSVLYEPFANTDAIAAALDRYWDEARKSLKLEGDVDLEEWAIADRALEIAKKEASRG